MIDIPRSNEAEQAVLGGIMMSPENYALVAELIRPEDFFSEPHRQMFRAMKNLTGLDTMTLADRLEQKGLLADVGGINYIMQICNETPSAANVVNYAKIVKDRSDQRRCIELGTKIGALDGTGKARIRDAVKMVHEVSIDVDRDSTGLQLATEWAAELIDHVSDLAEAEGGIIGVPTGYQDLDKAIGGFRPGDLIIMAGRPAMGKTALMLNMLLRASKAGHAAAVFELEMSGMQIMQRLTQVIGEISGRHFKESEMAQDESFLMKMSSAMQSIKKMPIYFDDRPNVSVADMYARCLRLKSEGINIGVVAVDYLQLIRAEGKYSGNKTAEVTEISRSLKIMAKELEVPVIVLSQLSRNLEQRPDKRPKMSDLRESGAIEQDADVILFVYRDSEYYPDENENDGVAEIIIAKQRNGATGTHLLTFLGEETRFENFKGVYVPHSNARRSGYGEEIL